MKSSVFIFGVISSLLANPAPADPGLLTVDLTVVPETDDETETLESAGVVNVWNTTDEFHVQVCADSPDWQIRKVLVYVDDEELDFPDLGSDFPCVLTDPAYIDCPIYIQSYSEPQAEYHLVLKLAEDMDLSWGVPDEARRTQHVVVGVLLTDDENSEQHRRACGRNPTFEKCTPLQFMNAELSVCKFTYECMHPALDTLRLPL